MQLKFICNVHVRVHQEALELQGLQGFARTDFARTGSQGFARTDWARTGSLAELARSSVVKAL